MNCMLLWHQSYIHCIIMVSINRNILILYGSQTGTAADYATQLSYRLQHYHFISTVLSMNEYNTQQLIYECTDTPSHTTHMAVIFICSTTGQGNIPDNMSVFYKFLLQKSLPLHTSLPRLQYSVFGLGDSSYPLFNVVARRLDIRLQQLGAQPIIDRVLGDDRAVPSGSDVAYIPWCNALCDRLVDRFGIPINKQIIPINELLPCRYNVTPIQQNNIQPTHHNIQYKSFGIGSMRYNLLPVQCVINQRITHKQHDQDVRHIEFDITPCHELHDYQCGDILLIQPVNNQQLVTEFIVDTLHMNPYDMIQIECVDGTNSLPDQCTLLELFQYHLDLFSIPKRSLLHILSQFTTNELHHDKLVEMSRIEYSTDYIKYITREHRSIAEVLYEFDSVDIPLNRLIEFIPRLNARQFSISSSCQHTPDRLSITAALVQWTTPLKRHRMGILSNYLSTLQCNTTVHVHIRRGSTFHLSNADTNQPIIMIGPGTGIAPFRAMCWQRYAEQHNHNHNNNHNSSIDVYFGCRKRYGDFYYSHEWKQLLQSNTIHTFHAAFSRDSHLIQSFDIDTVLQDDINQYDYPTATTQANHKKTYVQDKLLQNSQSVYNTLFHQNGILMLAGSSGDMPRNIYDTIVSIVQQHESCDESDAVNKVKQLQQQRRYIQETWG